MDTASDSQTFNITRAISVPYTDTNTDTPLSAKNTLQNMRNVVSDMLPIRNAFTWKSFFEYLNTDDDDDTKLDSLKGNVLRNEDISQIPKHYIKSSPSVIRRKLVTAGFAKGLGDELQEILGWAKNSSYTGQQAYSAGNNIMSIANPDSMRLMLSGDRPSALRAIFMMMYADNVGGRSAVGYVGPGGKYYLALRPSTTADTPLTGGRRLRRFKKQRVTRKYIQKKRNTKKKRKGIQHKIKKRFSRTKKKISKNGRQYQKFASSKKKKKQKKNKISKLKSIFFASVKI